MEDPVASASLAPSPTPIAAPVLLRRRSHLDSASYRTLSRLFSLCFHIHPSHSEASAPPEAELTATNPTGLDTGDSPPVPRDADFNRHTEDVEKEATSSGSPPTCSLATNQPSVADPTDDSGEAPKIALEDMDVLVESTCGKPGAVSEDPMVEAGLLVEDDEALKSVKACLEGEVDESVEEALCNNSEQLLLDAMMTNFTGLIDDIGVGAMPAHSCGVPRGEVQNNKESEDSKPLGGGTEVVRPASNLDYRKVDVGGFEEGEIEGELQDLGAEKTESFDEKPEGDSVSRCFGESCGDETRHQIAHLTPEIKGNDPVLNKDVNIRNDGQISGNRAQAVSYDDVLDWNKTPLPEYEDLKPGNKRKRHLTEERKAKKTKIKRLKRAKKRSDEGVRKLKLHQTPLKTKKEVHCRHYKSGNCRNGDSCDFSHDFERSTKSKPCTHFATGSCLKGEDCPYDHELSKYPCHIYEKNGRCFRRECKFSHVLSTTGATATTDAKKSDASLASGNTNLIEQTSSLKTSTVHNGEPVTPAPTKQQNSILKNLAGISIDSQKSSARIPKGVQFLPFGRGGSKSSTGHQDALSIEKNRNANSSQDQYLGGRQSEGQKIAKQSYQKPVPLLNMENSSNKTTLPIDSTTTPGSIHTQHEVSEASRILQEFLFGTGS